MASSKTPKHAIIIIFATIAVLATVAGGAADERLAARPRTANLTLHNLCSYPVWPLITANAGLPLPAIPGDNDDEGDEPVGRLDGDGVGLTTLAFPPGAWSGRVTARTGCTTQGDDDDEKTAGRRISRCATGESPPVTVAQVSVGGPGGLAEYSVSLVDGFNVAVVITPHGFQEGGRRQQCPSLGCAVDLGSVCPGDARAPGGGGCGAGATTAGLFKRMCPDTRTNSTDVEVTPQDCVAPGELKVVFCPTLDSVVNHHRRP